MDIKEDKTIKEVGKIKENIEDLRESLLFSLEKAMRNGEDIKKLEESTQLLVGSGERFKKNSSSLRKQHWWQKYKVPIIIGSGITLSGVVTAVIFLL